MVKERMDLLELLRNGGMDGDVDFLREALRVLVEGIMDAEVSSRIGAEYGERSPERVTQRNGYRSRAWDTRVGTMDMHIPKLREGSYFPSLLEPRRRSERALLAVIQQAYVEGVSTRRMDDLVKALGCEGISKSQVSRICHVNYRLKMRQELQVKIEPPVCFSATLSVINGQRSRQRGWLSPASSDVAPSCCNEGNNPACRFSLSR